MNTGLLRVSLLATLKINRAIALANRDEVGGMIEFHPDMSKGLLIKDIHFVKQSVNGAYVSFDDQSLAEYAERMTIDRNLPPHLWRTGWWHHHPFKSATPSGTDWETTNKKFGPSICPHFSLMYITSEGDPSAHLRITAGPLSNTQSLAVSYEWDGLNELPGFETFDADLKSLVSPHTYVYQNNSSNPSSSNISVKSTRFYKDPKMGFYVDRTDRSYFSKESNRWFHLPADYELIPVGDPRLDDTLKLAPDPDDKAIVVSNQNAAGKTGLDYLKGGTNLHIASQIPPNRPIKGKKFNVNMHSPISRDDAVSLAYKLHDCTPTANPGWACHLVSIYNRLSVSDRQLVSTVIESIEPDLLPLESTVCRFAKAYRLSQDKGAMSRLLERDRVECNRIICEQAEADDARTAARERNKYGLSDPDSHLRAADSDVIPLVEDTVNPARSAGPEVFGAD